VTRVNSETEPAAVLYLHEDHLGSVSVLTKGAAGAGEEAERRNFGHFGARELPTGASLSSFGYTGHRATALRVVAGVAEAFDCHLRKAPKGQATCPFLRQPSHRLSHLA
jgi:hypothetical protein